MTLEIITKIIIGFVGASFALILKGVIDYFKKREELKRLKKVLVTDLYHQCITATYFSKELMKLNNIYKKGIEGIKNKTNYDFYKELQSTMFNEVFFSKETFNTITKQDLLRILKNNPRSFGEIHNIYHITEKLKYCNTKYYEDLYDEHLIAYCDGIEKNDTLNRLNALNKALKFITLKIDADINNSEIITTMTYEYLVKLIGKSKVRSVYGLEFIKNNVAQQNV